MALVLAAAGTPAAAVAAGAAERPNVLILGEDADRDTVARGSQVFRRVLDALSGQLDEAGFDVFDETAVAPEGFARGRTRRSDDELIDIARAVTRPPIDVAVIFSIYASRERRAYTTRIRTRVTGRLLAVASGRRLGGFEVESPAAVNAPVDCDAACLRDVLGRNARILAQDLGAVLAQKLAAATAGGAAAPSAYTLIFNGFDRDDAALLEEYLVAYAGYRRHRLVFSGARRQEYWYESRIAAAGLDRNLKKTLDRLGLRGRIGFAGNVFTVDKIARRRGRPRTVPRGTERGP